MRKVTTLTDDIFNDIEKDGELGASLRKILGVPGTQSMRIGDTMCMIGQPSMAKDVFKYVHSGKEIFYIVINPVDDVRAFCYSIYPV